jgi:hypothetical protein
MIGKAARCALLAGLLLAASPPAAGQIEIDIKIGGGTAKLAKQLAQEVDRVQRKFAADRAALPLVKGPGGAPAYPRQAVLDLIDATEKDLDQAVARVKEPKLAGLRAWADGEIESSRHRLEKPSPSGTGTAAALSGSRSVAMFAVYRGGADRGWRTAPPRKKPPKTNPPPKAEPPKPEPPKPDPLEATTVGTAETNQLLGQVGRALERIFFLADKNDLEVKLWVGSTPAQHATFRFWPKSSAQGTPPAPTIITTNGSKKHILRGLYDYRASAPLGSKSVIAILESGAGPAGGAPSLASERLDLVNGSSFFCCRFDNNFCQHVDDEKGCQAERR